MTIEKIFEVATRTKMRFSFRGLISLEDLWDLSVRDLDLIFKGLNSELKKVTEESLLDTKTKEDKDLETKIEIVKYIVKVKLEEEDTRLKAKAQKEQKQKILEILSTKQDESLQNKSVDELKAMLEELED
ncbi:hypothetical protein [Niallia circulans]|uniref:hypothetical protein n=1 Tax=Niallia circulans TaxID=1397 RepID=UPI0026F0B523|nr:hypothetical protein [Niallia circulans]